MVTLFSKPERRARADWFLFDGAEAALPASTRRMLRQERRRASHLQGELYLSSVSPAIDETSTTTAAATPRLRRVVLQRFAAKVERQEDRALFCGADFDSTEESSCADGGRGGDQDQCFQAEVAQGEEMEIERVVSAEAGEVEGYNSCWISLLDGLLNGSSRCTSIKSPTSSSSRTVKKNVISVLTQKPIEEEIEKISLPMFLVPAILSSSYFLYGKLLFGAKASGASLLMTPPPAPASGQASVAETITESLFPAFKHDTFLKRICILQLLEYAGSLFLTMGSNAANSPAAQLMGTNFALSPNTCSLYLLGASWGPSIATGQIWRLLTPMMLHANGLHIFFNLFFQSRVGFGIEQQLGTKKFMILYLFCGYFGNLVSILVDPYKLAVGASTSAFGLLGVWFSEVHLTWHLLSEESKGRLSFWFGGMLLALVVMSNLAPHLDMWGHVGGLLGGYLMSLCLADMSPEHRPVWYETGKKLAKMTLSWFCLLGTGKVVFMNPTVPIPNCGTLLHPKNILM
ncbi:unnamed protein product [Amoebophrya sp. A120]|nr:unnamed protein product [Amoebophrya sp. A120]|eukprot:GSA120T00007932001.1